MMVKQCGQRLYEDGKLVAICTVKYGTEHSHHDMTASQAVSAGIARKVNDSDPLLQVALDWVRDQADKDDSLGALVTTTLLEQFKLSPYHSGNLILSNTRAEMAACGWKEEEASG